MFGRMCAACFTVALALTGLAMASAALNEQRSESSEFLDLLTVIFTVGALSFLFLCVVSGCVFVGVRIWRYSHSVEVLPGRWHFRFWPYEQVAEPSGIKVQVHEWAGAVKVRCRAYFGDDEVVFMAEIPEGSNGEYGPAFGQRKVTLRDEPHEGDAVRLFVSARPAWWRGRASERDQTLEMGITDHRPAPFTDTPGHIREAIARIDPLIVEAQAILDSCGRPHKQTRGADPMYFQKHCIPRINQFALDAANTIRAVAPEYTGKLENIGNVFHGTDTKPVMIQQVEAWLQNLGTIQDDLRGRL